MLFVLTSGVLAAKIYAKILSTVATFFKSFWNLVKIKPIRLIKPYLQLLTFFKFASITSLSTISFLTIVDDEGNDDKLNDGDLTIPSNMLFYLWEVRKINQDFWGTVAEWSEALQLQLQEKNANEKPKDPKLTTGPGQTLNRDIGWNSNRKLLDQRRRRRLSEKIKIFRQKTFSQWPNLSKSLFRELVHPSYMALA